MTIVDLSRFGALGFGEDSLSQGHIVETAYVESVGQLAAEGISVKRLRPIIEHQH